MTKILIIEDEKLLREALKKGLSDEGWEVAEAEDGKKGFNIAQSTHPDLILLDILMPEVDGITLLKELRKDRWGKTAKVIILTNFEDQDKLEQAKALGVLGYIVKSNWRIEDLVKLIKTHI